MVVQYGGERYFPFQETLVVSDGDSAYNSASEVAALMAAASKGGGWVKIWQRTTKAQEILAWGYGVPELPANQGYAQMAAVDKTTAVAKGKMRFRVANASETSQQTVKEAVSYTHLTLPTKRIV